MFPNKPFFLLFLISMLLGLSKSAANATELWGYVNLKGEEVIRPQFEQARQFNHGYAVVFGFNPVTKHPDYDHELVVDLHGNKSIVDLGTGKEDPTKAYITLRAGGKEIRQDNFVEVMSCRGSYRLLKRSYDRSVAVSEELVVKLPDDCLFDGVNPRNKNLRFVRKGQAYQFTGNAGELQMPGFSKCLMPKSIDSNYRYHEDFSEGLEVAEGNDLHWVFLDESGQPKIKLPVDCCAATSFHEGLAAVAVGGEPWINNGGYRGVSSISPLKGALYGFIDKTGHFVIPPRFPCPGGNLEIAFKDGFATGTVEKNGSIAYGLINRRGEWAIQPKYRQLSQPSEGLVAVNAAPVGFDKDLWKQRPEHEIITFLRQFDLLSLSKFRVIELLGMPARVLKDIGSDVYLLSHNCLGSVELAVHYDDHDKVDRYSVDSFPDDNSRASNSVPVTLWATKRAYPEIDEYIQGFFERVATKVISPPLVSPLDSSEVQNLDRVFETPHRQIQFDATQWKTKPFVRAAMLYGLRQQKIENWNPDQVESLLGKADRTDIQLSNFVKHDDRKFLFYKINLPDYDSSEAQLIFVDNKLSCLSVVINSRSGFSSNKYSDWVLANPKLNDIGEKLNQIYDFVGMPAGELCQITRTEAIEGSKLHSALGGWMELEFTADNSRVSRFRIKDLEPTTKDANAITHWFSESYWPDFKSASPARDDNYSSEFDADFYKPCAEFSSEKWRDQNARKWIVFDLVNSKKVIGRSVDSVRDLLGKPDFKSVDFRQYKDKKANCPRFSDGIDCYDFGAQGTKFFQLAYDKGVVKAFRFAEEPKEKDNRFLKTFFGKWHSFPKPNSIAQN